MIITDKIERVLTISIIGTLLIGFIGIAGAGSTHLINTSGQVSVTQSADPDDYQANLSPEVLEDLKNQADYKKKSNPAIAEKEQQLLTLSLKINDTWDITGQVSGLAVTENSSDSNTSAQSGTLSAAPQSVSSDPSQIPTGGYLVFGSDGRTRIFTPDGEEVSYSVDEKENQEPVPSGDVLPATHVLSLPNGATVNTRGNHVYITAKGDIIAIVISQPDNAAPGDSLVPEAKANSWVNYAETDPYNDLKEFETLWEIPHSPNLSAPTATQANILFDGVEPPDGSEIFQPVTAFDYYRHSRYLTSANRTDPAIVNKWTGASWYCPFNNTLCTHTSPAISFVENDTAQGYVRWSSGTGQWLIYTANVDKNTSTWEYSNRTGTIPQFQATVVYEWQPSVYPVDPYNNQLINNTMFHDIWAKDTSGNLKSLIWNSTTNLQDHTSLSDIGVDLSQLSSIITLKTFYAHPLAGFYTQERSGEVPYTVAFQDTSTNNPTQWHWDFGDGQNSTVQNPVHIYTSGGTYTVQLTASEDNGLNGNLAEKFGYITVTSPSPPITYYTVTPTSGSNGSINPGIVQAVASGGSLTFTITPDTGYVADNVTIDGTNIGSVSAYTFTNVVSSHTISATFKQALPATKIGVFRNSTGYWYIDTNFDGTADRSVHFGSSGDTPVVGDFNGDGTRDIGVFRNSTGYWYIDTNFDGTVDNQVKFGKTGDIPVVGDFNGDGTTDIGVFRPSTGYWYIDTNFDGTVDRSVHFGNSSDTPVVGDFNNDGTLDIGVFRNSTGYWYLDTNFDGTVDQSIHFGNSSDTPVVGDFNDDGTTDIGVFRPSMGNWYLDMNLDGTADISVYLGSNGDTPVAGDFNGDGKTDIGVFRPSAGNWYLDTNLDGTVDISVHLGSNGDTPVVGKWS